MSWLTTVQGAAQAPLQIEGNLGPAGDQTLQWVNKIASEQGIPLAQAGLQQATDKFRAQHQQQFGQDFGAGSDVLGIARGILTNYGNDNYRDFGLDPRYASNITESARQANVRGTDLANSQKKDKGFLGLGKLGDMAALAAGAYFGAPYLSSLFSGSTAAAGMGAWGGLDAAAIAGTDFLSGTAGALGAGIPAELGGNLGSSWGAETLSGAAPGGWGAETLARAAGGNPLQQLAEWAKTAGVQPWGSPGNLMSMGSGIYGMLQAEKLKKMAMQAASKADPWGESGGRALAGGQLQQLLQDPSSITSLPGWKAGLQAVQRKMGTMPGSGNMMTALQEYGGNFYNNALSQLSGLAGANLNPAAGQQLALQGMGMGNDAASRALATLGYGVQRTQPNTIPPWML